jgi:ELWxxDGT repeat protein
MLRANSFAGLGLILGLALAASPCRAVTVSAPYRVKEINPASAWGSAPSQMTAVGDTLFFETDSPQAIWKTDGTAAGTVRVADLHDMSNPIAFEDVLGFSWRSRS